MDLVLESSNRRDYLACTEVVDYCDPAISSLAAALRGGTRSDVALAERTYEFVRDQIAHSADVGGELVSLRASEVLLNRQGICYAKAHLLAALLRKNDIPSGFCYQLLRLNDEHSPLILHGLNAVYLASLGRWVRVDARGNKPGVDAQFSPDGGRLAFTVHADLGEVDYPYVFTRPDPNALNALACSANVQALWGNLPGRLGRML